MVTLLSNRYLCLNNGMACVVMKSYSLLFHQFFVPFLLKNTYEDALGDIII